MNPKIVINDDHDLTKPLHPREVERNGSTSSTNLNNAGLRQGSVQSAMRNSHSSSYSVKVNRYIYRILS